MNMTNNPSSSHLPTATAVIIGRAGSKGFPNKNAQLLAGIPIVKYSINSARTATTINRILISTDCPQIIQTAHSIEDVEIIPRPKDLADDTATIDAAVRHAITTTQDQADIVVILYANVPLRPTDLIDRAVNFLHESNADSVQSYTSVGKYHPFWESKLDPQTGSITPYLENTIYRRQDLPPLFIPDGGVIAVKSTALMLDIPNQPHAFLGNDRRGIENPPGTVIDIDAPIDLLIAEATLQTQAIQHPQPESVGAP